MAQVHRNQLPPETKKDAPAGKTVLKSVNLNEDKGVLMYGATGQDAYGPLPMSRSTVRMLTRFTG
ncbi:hypothetical protein PRLR5107_27550 [Prevotella lacticifex]|uniref:Uncharacterized protein n=2 Tax=Prevotella lacticifex TaxID=2854755 RepID=A0A9R1C8P8_9BACT|nr:hypothetical protein PRLR5003_30290 [Prevotella lacticifex]GJG41172.1 hypothetical protein PRLR5019_31430 [Prevotella lacticifex]GJG43355.1 hypothetical protein PRLR5025_21410 [Prevotella lacticifex]GJG47137.1 hypothetical protein PRLR5027_27320 [Prevotella lacticifex]GJG50212.1 hypothetical protein PRLR5052_26250 [Prevotella lacticifex]